MQVLTRIKLLHTGIWALIAGSILSLPLLALRNQFVWALAVAVVVLAEIAVLAANRGQCPLTAIAARHTKDRSANFDIYLPHWLARHNKTIFGFLFIAGELFVLWRWFDSK